MRRRSKRCSGRSESGPPPGYDGSACANAAVDDAQAVVVDARPAEALLQVASERKARMIVVGTHGERPLTGAVLGSVPHRLLHLSRVPVLVVPVRP